MVEFAQELIDAIIDEVAATDEWYDSLDRKSLSACALAARTFVAPSQRRLFQSLTLPVRHGDMKEVALEFTTSPHLGSYVQDLHFENVSHNARETDIASGTIFTMLSSVRRLVISGRKRWDPASREFYHGLTSMLARPSLRSIGLLHCGRVPMSLFFHIMSAGYEEVALATTDFDYDDSDSGLMRSPESGAHSTSTLLRLALAFWPERTGAVGDLMMSDHIAGSLEHVQHLKLTVRTQPCFDALHRIALKCVEPLQHLEIDFDVYHLHPIILPFMPGLRVLTLQAKVAKLRVPDSLTTMIATLPDCTPNVEIVNVIIDAQFEEYENGPHLHLTDSALQRLPLLRDVHFDIHTPGQGLHFKKGCPAAQAWDSEQLQAHDVQQEQPVRLGPEP
ncbi:hypothetical protein DFH06DRAFT_1475208 [Mycena polygramma]|nr:hypothetical protein DFH06DRAFT_1477567 [Mycena polygramma]KAJ7652349.1 hypothetical protein DFH06DRAFT_1475208 [Mycena polygramma]